MEAIFLSIRSLISGIFTMLANITVPALILYFIIKMAIKKAIKELKKENII